jgi:hypothetical protein
MSLHLVTQRRQRTYRSASPVLTQEDSCRGAHSKTEAINGCLLLQLSKTRSVFIGTRITLNRENISGSEM